MYAIVEAGGKQYRVIEGLRFKVDKLDALPGTEVVFDRVLLVSKDGNVQIGSPYVEGARVTCEVTGNERGKKLIIFYKRRRHDSHKKMGHRQTYTGVSVKSIQA